MYLTLEHPEGCVRRAFNRAQSRDYCAAEKYGLHWRLMRVLRAQASTCTVHQSTPRRVTATETPALQLQASVCRSTPFGCRFKHRPALI